MIELLTLLGLFVVAAAGWFWSGRFFERRRYHQAASALFTELANVALLRAVEPADWFDAWQRWMP